MTRIFLLLLAVAAGLAAAWFGLGRERGPALSSYKFRTAKVERGEVVEGVQASGAVQPVVLVQVGTQVSGVILKLNADFNSRVKAGQIVAELDPNRYRAMVAQDEAALARSRADVGRVKAQLIQAERELVRQRALFEKKLVGEAELDAAVATVDSLRAQIGVAEAAVAQSAAQLEGDRVNLGYCTIRSPIDGVVVSRNVDVGQTVAASLAAPTLYTVANDLTKIQVQASVPEADIGRIHEGQAARFSVDAHPEKVFTGRVSQVRLASTTVQNVVTYTVLVDADNPESLLLPGMTANVVFEISRSPKDGLKVASAALRVQPPDEVLEPAPPKPGEGDGAAADEKPAAAREMKGAPPGKGGGRPRNVATIYVRNAAGYLRPVRVRATISDGAFTAVATRDPSALEEGTEVVTSISREDDDAGATTNPFAPPRMGGGRRTR